jgi:hypothetical protein
MCQEKTEITIHKSLLGGKKNPHDKALKKTTFDLATYRTVDNYYVNVSGRTPQQS